MPGGSSRSIACGADVLAFWSSMSRRGERGRHEPCACADLSSYMTRQPDRHRRRCTCSPSVLPATARGSRCAPWPIRRRMVARRMVPQRLGPCSQIPTRPRVTRYRARCTFHASRMNHSGGSRPGRLRLVGHDTPRGGLGECPYRAVGRAGDITVQRRPGHATVSDQRAVRDLLPCPFVFSFPVRPGPAPARVAGPSAVAAAAPSRRCRSRLRQARTRRRTRPDIPR